MSNTLTKSKPARLRGIRAYLDGITSRIDRSRIRAGYHAALDRRGDPKRSPMNQRRREALYDAIFAVEDDLESRRGGQPDLPRVVAMRTARDRVADDLGWND